MAINPIGSGSSARIEPNARVPHGENAGAQPRPDAVPAAPVRQDRVEISADAIRLHSRASVGSEIPTEIPERMLDIGKRLAQDFYDQPSVQQSIIEKLKKEL